MKHFSLIKKIILVMVISISSFNALAEDANLFLKKTCEQLISDRYATIKDSKGKQLSLTGKFEVNVDTAYLKPAVTAVLRRTFPDTSLYFVKWIERDEVDKYTILDGKEITIKVKLHDTEPFYPSTVSHCEITGSILD